MTTIPLRPATRPASHLAWTAATLLGSLLAVEACAAIDLTSAQNAAGQWDMSLNDTNRKCRLTLRPEAVADAYAIAMPAGCKRAMPILADVGSWQVPSREHLRLGDAAGKPILEFALVGSDKLSASGPEGETYEMVAGNGVQLAQAKPQPVPGFKPLQAAPAGNALNAPAVAPPPVSKTPLPAAIVLKTADLAGRYSVFREGNKDTGCMLTLDDKARGLSGNKAQLAPACRDQGIVIFDPAGWSLDKGRLILTARKGHQTHLDLQADGLWLKDPKEGKSLSLKKF